MRLFIFAALAAAAAGTAVAQEAPLDKVNACAGISKSEDRLACYDAAVAGLKQAQQSGGVAVVSREQVAEAEKQAFGLGTARLSDVTRPPEAKAAVAAPEEIDSIKATITTAEKRSDGKFRFTLDNGQVWEQMENERNFRVRSTPGAAEIRKALLGSFMMNVDGSSKAIRVRRIK